MYAGVPIARPSVVRVPSVAIPAAATLAAFAIAEVDHQRVTPREHDVLRLDVAMDDTLGVRVGQRVEHVPE